MADKYQPTFGNTTIDPVLILKAWGKSTWDFGKKESYFQKFMGKSRESIIQIHEDLSRGKGTSIEVSLLMPLNGAGVIEDKQLEGKEERMNYRSCTVYLSRIRNAVRLEGLFEEQKNELTCVILCAKVKLLRNHTARRSASQIVSAILNVPACFVKHKGAFFMTELEQKLSAENEALQRENAELRKIIEYLRQGADPTPRVEYVDEKTRRFRGELYRKHEKTGYYVHNCLLHVAVYKFYHGLAEIPKNCLIHHDGKDSDGNYDKEQNDIEHLILMTRSEHTALHHPTISKFENFTCRICGKVFRGRKSGGDHYCSKECRLAVQKEIRDSGKYNETRTCAHCGKEFTTQKYKKTKYCSYRCGALAQWQRQKSERSDIGKADSDASS